MAQRKCRFCLYWHSRLPSGMEPKDESVGECRINPPVLAQPGEGKKSGEKKGDWPETFGGDWCGQFMQDRWPQSKGGYPRPPSVN